MWQNSFDSSQLQEYRGKNILIIHSRKEFYKDTIAGVDCEDVQEEKEIEEASENGIKGDKIDTFPCSLSLKINKCCLNFDGTRQGADSDESRTNSDFGVR